ncbi:MAG: hypothetical protein JNN20_12155 [Betaproteobacteria bacterium]|nr:hypothetical protein [Betaproteobacteria bacterium]
MNTPTTVSKDTVLMSSLLLSGLLMAFAVPVLNAQERRVDQAVKSVADVARTLTTPAALRHTQAVDAAIISAAPKASNVLVAGKSRREQPFCAV